MRRRGILLAGSDQPTVDDPRSWGETREARSIGSAKYRPDEPLRRYSDQNLTMRMHIRRLTRLTNALSKKWENLKAALALHFAWYNFCRVHGTLRVTRAMEARVADHIWTVRELITA